MSERTALKQANAPEDSGLPEVDLAAWTRMMTDLGHLTDASRARALKMDHAAISRLRKSWDETGRAWPSAKFIGRTTALGIPYSAVFHNGGQS